MWKGGLWDLEDRESLGSQRSSEPSRAGRQQAAFQGRPRPWAPGAVPGPITGRWWGRLTGPPRRHTGTSGELPWTMLGLWGLRAGWGGRVESKPTVVGRSEIPGNPVYFCDYNPVLDARLTWLKHTITLGLLYKIYNKNLILSCLQIFGVRSLTAGSSSTVCLQITERKTKAQSQLGEFRTERGPAVTHSCCEKSILPGSGGDQTQRR